MDGGNEIRERVRRVSAHAQRRAREFVGLLVGVVISALTLVWLVSSVATLVFALVCPPIRARALDTVRRWTLWLSGRELARLSRWMGATVHPEAGLTPRAVHLLLHLPWGLLSAYLALTVVNLAALLLGGVMWQSLTGSSDRIQMTWPGVSISATTTAFGLLITVSGLVLLWAMIAVFGAVDRWMARALIGPADDDLLRRRIDELTESRTGIVRAVDEERRRIERDLHDGVQQRVVALAMLLGRAQRGSDPERAAGLVRQAHTESQVLLDELREVAWRIYPTALDSLGVEAALTEASERGPLPIVVRCDVPEPLPSELATAVYFVAREAMTNATKHSGAREVIVDLGVHDSQVRLTVTDDGRGGADPEGSGLTGLARRVQALDGTLTVHSPPEGTTTVRAVLPLDRRSLSQQRPWIRRL